MTQKLTRLIPHQQKRRFLWLFFLLLVFPACSLFQTGDPIAEETLIAQYFQMTRLAHTQTKMAEILKENPTHAPQSLIIPETMASTISPTVELMPATVSPQGTPQPNLLSEDLERNLKRAKILLFEDMSASKHLRYVKEALDREGYFYQDVGSAKGWFKSQLLSSVEWDLVIAAAEARRDFGGEFFEYLDQQIEKGASVIVEYWDWDVAPTGKAQLLLNRCGVSHQSDWFEPDLRVFFWLEPENPVFNQPNQVSTGLRNAAALWSGDLGDLFMLDPNGNQQDDRTTLLAGTSPLYQRDHAILVSCVDGRVILQGFSSHEYAKEDMIALWQNYIYQALISRFVISPPYKLPPVSYTIPQTTQTPGFTGKLGEKVACGESLIARVSEAPTRQRDLFEHHAKGEYLIMLLEMGNFGIAPVQIYDQDYFLYGLLNGEVVVYQPDKAATGYLFIQNSDRLYQDLINPGIRWQTNLAFDVDPRATDLTLVLRPGAEFNHQYCEVSISLELDYTQE